MENSIHAVANYSIAIGLSILSIWNTRQLVWASWRVRVLVGITTLILFSNGTGHILRLFPEHDAISTPSKLIGSLPAYFSFIAAVCFLTLLPGLIKELNESGKTLQQLQEQVQTCKTNKAAFMSFVSHEIRNPLFAITSNLAFLEDGPLNDEQLRTVTAIDQAAGLMLRLVNDILDLANLESGNVHLNERDFDLRELLNDMAEHTKQEIKMRHKNSVDFLFTMDTSVPRFVRGDAARIVQVAYNLLSNATKFTEQGRIELSVSAEYAITSVSDELHNFSPVLVPSALSLSNSYSRNYDPLQKKDFTTFHDQQRREINHNRMLKLQVKDSGIGISPDVMKDLFKPYTPTKLLGYRKHGGTGLGLSILSKLLQVMGGKIDVKSQEGSGSTFVVYLPLQLSRDSVVVQPGEAFYLLRTSISASKLPLLLHEDEIVRCNSSPDLCHASSHTESPTSCMRTPSNSVEIVKRAPLLPDLQRFQFARNTNVVLVVDDNKVNRKLICRMLVKFNIDFREAANGKEAVDIILQSRNVTENANSPLFGLVLIDLCMPVMGGCEAIRMMRNHNIQIPIIALTANALEECQRDAVCAGADEFATKPIRRSFLYEKLRKYLTLNDPSTRAEESCSRLEDACEESICF